MDAQLWFIAAVLLFVVAAWINTLSRWSLLIASDDETITVQPFLRRNVKISWQQVRGPAPMFESFLPRVILRTGERFLTFAPSYVVLLRGRTGEREMIEKLVRTVGIKQVRNIGDAF